MNDTHSVLLHVVGNLKAACAAVMSYLLFLPADETMLHNKDYYSIQPKVMEDYFVPREVCNVSQYCSVTVQLVQLKG